MPTTRPSSSTVASSRPFVTTPTRAPFEPRVALDFGSGASAAELRALEGLLVCTSFDIADSHPGLVSFAAGGVLQPISEFPGCDGEDAGVLFGGPEGGTIYAHEAEGARMLTAGYLVGGASQPIGGGQHLHVLDVGSVSGRAVALATTEAPDRDLVLVDLESGKIEPLAEAPQEPFYLTSGSLSGNLVLLAIAEDNQPGDPADTPFTGLQLLTVAGEPISYDLPAAGPGQPEIGPAALAPDGTSIALAIRREDGGVAAVVIETSKGGEIARFDVAPPGHRVTGLRFDGDRILVMREIVRDFGFPMAHPVVVELAAGAVTQIDFAPDSGPWQLAFPLSLSAE